MAVATKARYVALREAILEAMEQRIAASGLSGFGMRDIAEAVGCSPGMIYKVGVDHDELVLMVNARTLDAIGTVLSRAATAADTPGSALRNVALAYLDYAQRNTPRWDALFLHRMGADAPLPEWYADKRDAMFRNLAAVVAPAVGGTSNRQMEAFSRTLFSAVHGVVTLGLQEKIGRVSLEVLRDQVQLLVDLIAVGLNGSSLT